MTFEFCEHFLTQKGKDVKKLKREKNAYITIRDLSEDFTEALKL